jgi:hypothetical protein
VLFADIYHKYPEVWKSRIASSKEVIEDFWAQMEDHPLMQCTPLAGRANYRQTMVPLRLHGDEVPVTGVGKAWQKMFLFLSWTARGPFLKRLLNFKLKARTWLIQTTNGFCNKTAGL